MADIAVNEKRRLIRTTSGKELNLTDVTVLNLDGSFIRMECAEGYVLVNPAHVEYIIIKGERVV